MHYAVFLVILLWLILSPHSGLCSKVTLSERPPLTALAQETALSLSVLSLLMVFIASCCVTAITSHI